MNTQLTLKGGDDRMPLAYICGEKELEGSGNIDHYFSGKKNRLALNQSEQGFFELEKVNTTYFSLCQI